MAEPSAPRRWTQNRQVAWRAIEGEAVLVIPRTSEVKVLNPVGTRVWELLDSPRTLEELVVGVVAEFEVAPDAARADVERFVSDLESRGLIFPVEPPPEPSPR